VFGPSVFQEQQVWARQYDSEGNTEAEDSAARITFEIPVPAEGRYEVALRWTPRRSGFRLSSQVPVIVEHAGGRTRLGVDQSRDAAQWNRLGTFRFPPPSAAVVEISANAPGGNVVVDAVRVRRASAGED